MYSWCALLASVMLYGSCCVVHVPLLLFHVLCCVASLVCVCACVCTSHCIPYTCYCFVLVTCSLVTVQKQVIIVFN